MCGMQMTPQPQEEPRWNKLMDWGPAFDHFPNPSKTWIVTKPEHVDEAIRLFADSGINITPEGRPYFGGAIGT